MPSLTAELLGSGAIGAILGWGLSFISSERSFRRAKRQADEAHRREREEMRRGALLAVAWELELNQERLERAKGTTAHPWFPLAHEALDAASPWYSSLPPPARGAVHDALMKAVRFNDSDNQPHSVSAGMADPVIKTASQARSALDAELAGDRHSAPRRSSWWWPRTRGCSPPS